MINEPDREDTIDFLEKEIGKAEERIRKLESKYNELLMAVKTKHPEETRHQTALRYIRQREASCHGPHHAGKQS